MPSPEAGVVQGSFPQGLQRAQQVFQASRGTLPRPVPPSRGAVAFQVPPNWLPRGPGQPLPPALQARMESLFRADFSDVRVHVGPEAGGLGALALAHGSHLYFAAGRYDPASPAGQRLIAHELTHVVQQKAGRVGNPFGRGLALVQDSLLEAEAERMAVRVTTAVFSSRSAAHAVAQRSPAPHAGRVLQTKWDPVNGKDYQVWDSLINGRRWYRQQTPSGYQYYSEPADQNYLIKIFLTPGNISGGVPNVLLPPPQMPIFSIPSTSGNLLMPPPLFLPPRNNNNTTTTSSSFKMPSLPVRKSGEGLGMVPPLSSQQTVLSAGPNTQVTLARGCNSLEQFNAIVQNSTAGGASATLNPSAPSEEQAISGVAFEGVPWQVTGERQMVRRRVDYTEYSTSSSVTQSFGSRGGVVIIRVAKKWITQGSGSESGWFINDNTPVTVIWSRNPQSEPESRQKLTNIKVSTTQSEAEEFRKNNRDNGNDGNGGNGGNFIF